MSRRLFTLFAAALLAGACTPVPPDTETAVAPPPPPPPSPHFTEAEIRRNVEKKVAETLGAEALQQGQAAGTSILATSYQGRFDAGGPRVAVAIRGGVAGWTSWKSGGPAPLAAAAGAELDQLLNNPALWREEPFYPEMDCPDAGATMMVIRHRGQVRVSRQGCSPAGLLGRLETVVLKEPVPS